MLKFDSNEMALAGSGEKAERHRLSTAAQEAALRTINLEQQALGSLAAHFASTDLGDAFSEVVDLIIAGCGRVVMTGMGKSGLIGRRIAATLASTGIPALFLHPAEASHGDLGMIAVGDVVVAVSWSGETLELLDVVGYCSRFRITLVGICANASSTLASHADLALILPEVIEACPNNLAPTSSAAVLAAVGDAIVVAVAERRQFTSDDFRVFHPRGRLGARLTRVGDVMSTGTLVPKVSLEATLAQAIIEMSAKRFGITAVVDGTDALIGVFSDGDLRRSLIGTSLEQPVSDHMNRQPLSVASDMLITDALKIMNHRSITQLFVCSDTALIGIIHLHDILRIGVA